MELPGPRLQDRNPSLYLGIGVLSLAKAALLRRAGRSARRDLRDAGLFIGAGLALRSYQRRRRAGAETASGEAGSDEDAAGGEERNAEETDAVGTDAEETDETGETEDAGGERGQAADEPVLVASPDEETGTGSDRRSPVAEAVERLSQAPIRVGDGRS